jgi:hypothetical protein
MNTKNDAQGRPGFGDMWREVCNACIIIVEANGTHCWVMLAPSGVTRQQHHAQSLTHAHDMVSVIIKPKPVSM